MLETSQKKLELSTGKSEEAIPPKDSPTPSPSYRQNQQGFLIPLIAHHTSVAVYFSEFYQANKSREGFTYRKFAEQMRWPDSYLSDLIAERKPLTVSRAVEFASFAEMNSYESERLILIGLKDSDNSHLQGFFNRLINTAVNPVTPSTSSEIQNIEMPSLEEKNFDHFFLLLEGIVSWRKCPCPLTEIKSIFQKVSEKFFFNAVDLETEFANALKTALELGCFRIDQQQQIVDYRSTLKGDSAPLGFATMMDEILTRRDFGLATNDINRPRIISVVGYRGQFSPAEIEELKARIEGITNWAKTVANETRSQPDYDPTKTSLINWAFFLNQIAKPIDHTIKSSRKCE